MFCPQCGHQQISNETRFCSRCGLSLTLMTHLVANSKNKLQQEKRELTGIGLMIGAILMLMNFLIVFGSVTLPHLGNSVFLWIWISFVLSSLLVGGFGLANLIRSGFFRRLKERDSLLRLMKLDQERQLDEAKSAGLDAASIPRLVEPMSVTETTTRELQTKPRLNESGGNERTSNI